LEEISLFPPVRAQQSRVKTTHLPPFLPRSLIPFKADYKDLEKNGNHGEQEPEKYPLRKAILEAIKVLEKSGPGDGRKIDQPRGSTFDPKVKEACSQ